MITFNLFCGDATVVSYREIHVLKLEPGVATVRNDGAFHVGYMPGRQTARTDRKSSIA